MPRMATLHLGAHQTCYSIAIDDIALLVVLFSVVHLL